MAEKDRGVTPEDFILGKIDAAFNDLAALVGEHWKDEEDAPTGAIAFAIARASMFLSLAWQDFCNFEYGGDADKRLADFPALRGLVSLARQAWAALDHNDHEILASALWSATSAVEAEVDGVEPPHGESGCQWCGQPGPVLDFPAVGARVCLPCLAEYWRERSKSEPDAEKQFTALLAGNLVETTALPDLLTRAVELGHNVHAAARTAGFFTADRLVICNYCGRVVSKPDAVAYLFCSATCAERDDSSKASRGKKWGKK